MLKSFCFRVVQMCLKTTGLTMWGWGRERGIKNNFKCRNKMFLCIKNLLGHELCQGPPVLTGSPGPLAHHCCPPQPLCLGHSKPSWHFLFLAKHGVRNGSSHGMLSLSLMAAWPAAALPLWRHTCQKHGPGLGDLNLPLCERL